MPENIVNPDVVCQRVMQAQLNVFRANENAGSMFKIYNDTIADTANTISLMKARNLELEEELRKKGPEKKKE